MTEPVRIILRYPPQVPSGFYLSRDNQISSHAVGCCQNNFTFHCLDKLPDNLSFQFIPTRNNQLVVFAEVYCGWEFVLGAQLM